MISRKAFLKQGIYPSELRASLTGVLGQLPSPPQPGYSECVPWVSSTSPAWEIICNAETQASRVTPKLLCLLKWEAGLSVWSFFWDCDLMTPFALAPWRLSPASTGPCWLGYWDPFVHLVSPVRIHTLWKTGLLPQDSPSLRALLLVVLSCSHFSSKATASLCI